MDEQALIQSALHGEPDAFNRLVLFYQDLAYNVAFRMVNDEDLAADAVQNAFISAYRNLRSYHGGSFKAWVLRMVTNCCYDELRRIQRRPTTSLEPISSEDGEVITLEQSELEHAIQHCLEKLPVDFRAVVVLVDIQGMDYEEVAQSVRTPLGTIKSRLARARLKLRDCLQGFQELLPSQYRLEGEERK
jgi:RNA polymerase sigma-70 factor (ECF subfamily)